MANQFRLLLASAAYVLIEHLGRVGLTGTELAKARVTTIRARIFKIAAQVTGSSHSWPRLFSLSPRLLSFSVR